MSVIQNFGPVFLDVEFVVAVVGGWRLGFQIFKTRGVTFRGLGTAEVSRSQAGCLYVTY